jgi:tetratricopeptide (TPR) repeat protein
VVVHIEDIHWADDRSLDVINNLVRENTDIPLFVLCMARPTLYERRPQWGEGQRFHERIQLEPLSQLSSRRLVKELLKKVDEVPANMRDLIVERADGNPFYIEEMIKALIDDRVIIKGDDEWTVDAMRLSDLRIPATLTGVVQSRLDTLPAPLYQLLQRASVVGRIFWDSAAIELSKDAGLDADEVRDMLEELREREMLLRREESNFAGTVEYIFRHAILRDVTYDTVVPRQRRALHKQAADWLIELGGERAGEHTILVAEHYGRADEPGLAAAQLERAGTKAINLGTFSEARTLLTRARDLLEGDQHQEQKLRIDVSRAHLEAVSGSEERAREVAEDTVAAARELDHKPLLAQALGQLARLSMWRGDRESMARYLNEALPIAREVNDKPALIFILRQLGNLRQRYQHVSGAEGSVQSDLELSKQHLAESIALAREIGDRNEEASGLNSLGNTLMLLARTLKDAGDPAADAANEAARTAYDAALDLFKDLGHRSGVSMVIGNRSELDVIAGNLDAAIEQLVEGYRISDQIGDRYLAPSHAVSIALLHLRKKEDDKALSWVMKVSTGGRMDMGRVFALGVLMVRRGMQEVGLEWAGHALSRDEEGAIAEELQWSRDELCHGLTPESAKEIMDRGAARTSEEILEATNREFA